MNPTEKEWIKDRIKHYSRMEKEDDLYIRLDESGRLEGVQGEFELNIKGLGVAKGVFDGRAGIEYEEGSRRIGISSPNIESVMVGDFYPEEPKRNVEDNKDIMQIDREDVLSYLNDPELHQIIINEVQQGQVISGSFLLNTDNQVVLAEGTTAERVLPPVTLEQFVASNEQFQDNEFNNAPFTIEVIEDSAFNKSKTIIDDDGNIVKTKGSLEVLIRSEVEVDDEIKRIDQKMVVDFETPQHFQVEVDRLAVTDLKGEEILPVKLSPFYIDNGELSINARAYFNSSDNQQIEIKDIPEKFKRDIRKLVRNQIFNNNELDGKRLFIEDEYNNGVLAIEQDDGYYDPEDPPQYDTYIEYETDPITNLSLKELYLAERQMLIESNHKDISLSDHNSNPFLKVKSGKTLNRDTALVAVVWVRDNESNMLMQVSTTGVMSEKAEGYFVNKNTGDRLSPTEKKEIESLKNNSDFEFKNEISPKDISFDTVSIQEAYEEVVGRDGEMRYRPVSTFGMLDRGTYNGIIRALNENASAHIKEYMNNDKWLDGKEEYNEQYMQIISDSYVAPEGLRIEKLNKSQEAIAKRFDETTGHLKVNGEPSQMELYLKSQILGVDSSKPTILPPISEAVVLPVMTLEGSDEIKENNLVSDADKAAVMFYDATQPSYRKLYNILSKEDLDYSTTTPEKELRERTIEATDFVLRELGYTDDEGNMIPSRFANPQEFEELKVSYSTEFERLAVEQIKHETGYEAGFTPSTNYDPYSATKVDPKYVGTNYSFGDKQEEESLLALQEVDKTLAEKDFDFDLIAKLADSSKADLSISDIQAIQKQIELLQEELEAQKLQATKSEAPEAPKADDGNKRSIGEYNNFLTELKKDSSSFDNEPEVLSKQNDNKLENTNDNINPSPSSGFRP